MIPAAQTSAIHRFLKIMLVRIGIMHPESAMELKIR
jgi:hypothetical protein